jgi:hypothetical protein
MIQCPKRLVILTSTAVAGPAIAAPEREVIAQRARAVNAAATPFGRLAAG